MVWLISWWPLLAEQGLGTSSLFTVDTRWGFSDGASVSGLFRIDTRLSGSASAGASGLFTVDTLGAGVGSATLPAMSRTALARIWLAQPCRLCKTASSAGRPAPTQAAITN